MNRKGLSDVITTVLIILLALAAVVIVWSFIKPTLQDSGKQIQATTDCTKLELIPTDCNYTDGSTAVVKVQWKSGDVKLSKINIVLSDTSGNTKSSGGGDVAPVIFETKSVTVANINTLVKVGMTAKAAGIVVAADGSEQTCGLSQETAVCHA